MRPLVQRPIDKRRRWIGLFFLIASAAMLTWGSTWLAPYLKGTTYLIYWLVCFLFTTLAMGTALLDMWVIRSRARQERKALAEEVFKRAPVSDRQSDPHAGVDHRNESA
jgi:hypothetical protein